MNVLAIADDATGALEVGAKLAAGGLRPLVTIRPALHLPAEAVVVDTETRHSAPPEARALLWDIAREARRRGVPHVYKKTDSTLRGNIGVEFDALLEVFPGRPLVYAPAYPALGRTVERGRLNVNGIPLERSAFAADLRNPVRASSIPELLAGACRAPVLLAPEASTLAGLLDGDAAGTVIVCDGSRDEDLAAVASVLAARQEPYLPAGPCGLFEHWIKNLFPDRCCASTPRFPEDVLIVNGSVHPVSVEQILAAERSGLPVFRLPSAPVNDIHTISGVRAALISERWAALAAPLEKRSDPGKVAADLASITLAVLDRQVPGALFILGGDTTFALLRRLGIDTLEPRAELWPGVPISSANFAGCDLAIITKAGGFGDADLLSCVRQWQQP